MKSVISAIMTSLLSLLMGCDISVDSKPQTLEVYCGVIAIGKKVCSSEINKKDEVFQYVVNLLKSEKEGWRPSFLSYAPCIRVISEDRLYVLNICPKKLVINKQEKDNTRSIQLVKTVPATVYDRLLKIVKGHDLIQQCNEN